MYGNSVAGMNLRDLREESEENENLSLGSSNQ